MYCGGATSVPVIAQRPKWSRWAFALACVSVAGFVAQDGFASGANERLTLGRFEQSLVWFHQQVAQASGRNL